MKNLSFNSFGAILLFCGIFLLSASLLPAQKKGEKTVWTFTNSTGEDANDLHIHFSGGCLPTNIKEDENKIKRAGGVFTDYPKGERASPAKHDYKGGTVAAGGSITLQFDNAVKPNKWWWTKDGKRIGDIELADSEDLASATVTPALPGYLDYRPKGTGQTTGHIANLHVFNPTSKPVTLTIPVCFIPSDGKNQSYVVASEITATIGANQETVVPLTGFCADIYKPATPAGVAMPNPEEWVFEQDGTTGSVQSSVADAVVNESENPRLFGELCIDAIKNIEQSYNTLKNDLVTPYSNNPAKERETVLQHTFWLYTSTLSGNPYKIENLRTNVVRQFETESGQKFKNADPATQQEINKGVQNLWSSFEMVGIEAKVLNVSNQQSIEPEDVDDPSDLPVHIRNMYNRYAVERQMGKSHDEALRTAVRAPGLRDRWGATFKRLYGN